MNSTRIALVAAFILAGATLTACNKSIIVVGGIEVYEKVWNKTLKELGPRAGFELECPFESMDFVLLRREGRLPTEVGVTGCGRRASYARVGTTWFASHQGAEAAAEQARLEEQERQRRQEQERQRQERQRQQQLQQQRQQQQYTPFRGY